MRQRKCSSLISSSVLARGSPHSLLMVKRCFSVAKAATPNRRMAPGKPVKKVALKLPRAADICTKASSSRSVKSAFQQGTRTGSGRSSMRNAQPQTRLGESLLATLEKTRRSAFAQTQAAATEASAGLRKPAKPSVLDMLRANTQPHLAAQGRLREDHVLASPTVVPPAIATDREPNILAGADSTDVIKNAVLAVARKIDAGSAELTGGPWVQPAELTRRAEKMHSRKRTDGPGALTCDDVRSLVLQPSVFVWAPDLMFPDLKLACPLCGNTFSEKRWKTPKLLHGLSALHGYIAREYICSQCARDGSQARQRRSKFVADMPALFDKLPDHVKSLWPLHGTGRTLCDVTLLDFARSMATRTSWSAIADGVNEARQTSWVRSVTAPYYSLCARFSIRAGTDAPAPPAAHQVTRQWISGLYKADAEKRKQEVQEEFEAEKGDDVLVLDWTRDAAARCGREWLFNAMDGQHFVLCSELTAACKPADVSHILQRLFDRGVKPKVIYVDEECCGAWPPLVSALWPDAVVRLDGMHAIRRLMRTTSSTQHPWHGRLGSALSNAIYTASEQAAEVGQSARCSADDPEPLSQQRRQPAFRKIEDPQRIISSIEAVLQSFNTPCTQAGALLTQETFAAWQSLRKHVAKGCLCDPSGVELNSCRETDTAGDSRQAYVRNARGSSALEGFHTHQKGWLGPLSTHSADAGMALLADGAQRWNRRIRSRQSPAGSPSSVYAPGLLKAVEAARILATEMAK